jgi:lysophospholipase L1-like esterase
MPLPRTIGSGRALIWIRRNAESGGLPVPSNNIVTAIGDSITLASAVTSGGTAPGVTAYTKYHAQLVNSATPQIGGYLTWACVLPKTGESEGTGKMRWGGVHATGSITTNTILTTHIQGTDSPLNDSPKAGICVICAGANDLAALTTQAAIDSRIADIETMCDALVGAGILPVIATPPANNNPGNTNLPAFVASLNTFAAGYMTGLICVDFFEATRAPGQVTWNTNYNAAGTDPAHPSVIGARAMGQILRDAIDALLPATVPTLATTATDDSANYLYKNGSCTDDGNADGIPDGGMTQSATYWSSTANGAAYALAPRTGFNGKAWEINKTTDPGDTALSGTGAGSPIIILTDGHDTSFGFKAEVVSWAAATRCDFGLWKQSDATTKFAQLRLGTDSLFSGTVAPFVWFQQFTVPAGYAGDANLGKTRLGITIGGTGTSTMDVHIGQITVRDDSV